MVQTTTTILTIRYSLTSEAPAYIKTTSVVMSEIFKVGALLLLCHFLLSRHFSSLELLPKVPLPGRCWAFHPDGRYQIGTWMQPTGSRHRFLATPLTMSNFAVLCSFGRLWPR
jgi:hypothetical protein